MLNLRSEQHRTNYDGKSLLQNPETWIYENWVAVKQNTTHPHFGGKIALLHELNSKVNGNITIIILIMQELLRYTEVFGKTQKV